MLRLTPRSDLFGITIEQPLLIYFTGIKSIDTGCVPRLGYSLTKEIR